jgi:hypothetical protein
MSNTTPSRPELAGRLTDRSAARRMAARVLALPGYLATGVPASVALQEE